MCSTTLTCTLAPPSLSTHTLSFPTGAKEAEDFDVLNQISETDILLDSSMTPEQKDMLLALLDPLGDDEGVDLIGQELPEPEDSFKGLSEVCGLEGA